MTTEEQFRNVFDISKNQRLDTDREKEHICTSRDLLKDMIDWVGE